MRDLLGTGTLDLALDRPTTVGQVLGRLVEQHPVLASKLWDADGARTGYITILLNGRSIEYLQGPDTPAADDDALALFPPVGGG